MGAVHYTGMRIAIFASIHRPHARDIVGQTIAWLLERGHDVRLEESLAAEAGHAACGVATDSVIDGAGLAIAIGGDGTMLGAVRIAAPHHVPVLGVNAGALGFLTQITPDELFTHLPQVLRGEYEVQSRMMLHATLYREEHVLTDMLAFNDIVVGQGPKGRIIQLDALVAGHRIGRFSADGVIVSSPTGSTAYGLAAGGPIVHPATSVLVLVPISPHSLALRPMVIPATDPVEIICEGNKYEDEMRVNADGQDPFLVRAGDRVVVSPAPERALLVVINTMSFYDRLRQKLHWGG